MSQTNSLVNEDRNKFYSKFNIEELEAQLLKEKSVENRVILRQVIRTKMKELKAEGNLSAVHYSNEQAEEIENLNKLLKITTDFVEQCKIRSKIMRIKRNENKVQANSDQKMTIISTSTKNISAPPIERITETEYKTLIYDELSAKNIEKAIVKINDSVKFIWIIPLRLLNSINYVWQFNDQDMNILQNARTKKNFNGSEAILTLTKVKTEDSGVYKITIHSQRLKRNSIKFRLVVNKNMMNNEPSFPIIEELEEKMEKTDIPTLAPQTNVIKKPTFAVNKNKSRHKTIFGEELLSGYKSAIQKNVIPTNNTCEEFTVNNPPKQNVPRRINRSATSSKDIILTFCKLNTEEYQKYGVCVENLSSSWNDGLAFCALIHHFYPESFDFSKLNKLNRRNNFELAFNTAEKFADICPLLDIDDMLVMERPDWKCVFTYVQSFYQTLRSHPKNRLKTVPM